MLRGGGIGDLRNMPCHPPPRSPSIPQGATIQPHQSRIALPVARLLPTSSLSYSCPSSVRATGGATARAATCSAPNHFLADLVNFLVTNHLLPAGKVKFLTICFLNIVHVDWFHSVFDSTLYSIIMFMICLLFFQQFLCFAFHCYFWKSIDYGWLLFNIILVIVFKDV